MSNQLCKRRLAILWLLAGLAAFLLMIAQSVFGKYGSTVSEAWAWLLPTIMPTLSLIIGVVVLDATTEARSDKEIDGFVFYLAFALSALYLLLVIATPLAQPFTTATPLEFMKRSNLWLGPLQGLVAGALGAFFVKGERGKGKKKAGKDEP